MKLLYSQKKVHAKKFFYLYFIHLFKFPLRFKPYISVFTLVNLPYRMWNIDFVKRLTAKGLYTFHHLFMALCHIPSTYVCLSALRINQVNGVRNTYDMWKRK